MPKTIGGTEVPTLGDLKTSEGRKGVGRIASAAFVATAVATPVVMAGYAIGRYIHERVKGATASFADAFRGL